MKVLKTGNQTKKQTISLFQWFEKLEKLFCIASDSTIRVFSKSDNFEKEVIFTTEKFLFKMYFLEQTSQFVSLDLSG